MMNSKYQFNLELPQRGRNPSRNTFTSPTHKVAGRPALPEGRPLDTVGDLVLLRGGLGDMLLPCRPGDGLRTIPVGSCRYPSSATYPIHCWCPSWSGWVDLDLVEAIAPRICMCRNKWRYTTTDTIWCNGARIPVLTGSAHR